MGSGRAMDEEWIDRWAGWGTLVIGEGIGMCTAHRLDVTKPRVVPALP